MLNTDPSRSSQSTKSVSLFNSFRKKLFFPKNSFLEIDLNVCEEFLQKEETPKSDSNFFSQTFRKWNGGSSHTLFLRPEPSVRKLKRQTTEVERFVRMDLSAKQRPSVWGTMTLWDGLELLRGGIRVASDVSKEGLRLTSRRWTKTVALPMIFVFLFEFVFLPVFESGSLFADPFDQNFENKNKAKGRLESYYNAAEKTSDALEWQSIVESGKRILKAQWEANASLEIEKELKNFSGTSSAKEERRIQLENQKQTIAVEWESDLSEEILEKRGSWKANFNKQNFESYFTVDKKKEIRDALENLVKAADAAKNAATGDGTVRLAAWDNAINAGIAGVRALWENNITSIKNGVLISSTATALTGVEKIEFEKKLGEIESYYKNYFRLEENGMKLPARQGLIQSLNRDMDIAIAQEEDPTQLTELLIERTKQQLDPATGQLLNSLDDLGTIPTSYDDVSGSNAQEKILQALQDGQALWDQAIERLVVKKLEYDRVAEDKRVRNEDKWSKAYYVLLDAKAKWNEEINKQIEEGLKKWDESEVRLKENKQKALQELNQYLSISQEQYVSHLNGLQGTILSSADTIGSIVSNIAWYQDQIDKENRKSSPNSGLINTYQQEINKWTALRTQFRQYVASVQNKIHDEDILGNNGGSGVLDDNGNSSDPYLYSSAEFEYRLAKAELDELEKKKNRAQAVWDYAEANVNVTNMPALQTELEAAKTVYETQQSAYLALLQQLNGTSPVGGGTQGTDPNSSSGSGSSTPPANTSLSELEAAKKLAEEKSIALTTAQAELELARKRFDQAKQLQILVLNSSPEFLGDIGSVNMGTYDPNAPNGGIKYEIYQADLQIAEAREKLKDNEKVYFSKNYDQANAKRTEDFFGDLWNRIQSFESSKEKLKLLEDAVSNPNQTLVQKVNLLLNPANLVLVSVFGNQGAAQVKSQLQGLVDALSKTVIDNENGNVEKQKLPYAVEKFSSSLDPILTRSDELLSQFDNTDKGNLSEFTTRMGNISSFLNSFTTNYNLNSGYLKIEDFNVWNSALSNSLSKWNENVTAFQTAKTDFSSALAAYKAYATSHVGSEDSLEYQLEVQKVTAAFGTYQEKTSSLEEYWDDLSTRTGHLRLEALDRLQKARTMVDMSTLDLATRKTLKAQIDTFKSTFSKKDSSGNELPDDVTALLTGTDSKFTSVAGSFSNYSTRYSYYRNTIDERSAIFSGMSGILIQALEGQRASVTAQKAQLGFLLDEDAGIEELQDSVSGVEETAKTEAAKLDARVAEILLSKLGNLGSDSSTRKFDPIYLGLTNEINSLYSTFTGSSDQILEIRARKIALDYIKNAGQTLTGIFTNNSEYSKFQIDLNRMKDRSAATLSFYEDDHGYLNEADRISLRMSEDENDRRKVSEYFSFGSTFLFGNAVIQGTSAWLNLAGGMKSFSEAVKSGAILSGLRDDYFSEQESEANGLFQELTEAAGIGSYSSVDFYKDSIRSQAGVDQLDTAKINQKKAELAALIAGMSDPQTQLSQLIQSGNLTSVFGLLTGTGVKQDLVAWQKEIDDAKLLFQTLDGNIQAPMTNLTTQFDSLLNFFNTPAFAQMQSYADGVFQSVEALKGLEDSNLPIYDRVNDADGNSPYEQAPDQDGDAVGSANWTPTYVDANGKLPWQTGYDSAHLKISIAWTPTYRDANGKIPGESGYNASNLKILGYTKPFENLNTDNLKTMRDSLKTALTEWNGVKSDAQAKLNVYKTSVNALLAFRALHPTDFAEAEGGKYLTLVEKVRTDGLALTGTHSDTIAYFNGVSLKFQDLKSEQEFLTRTAKQILGLPINKILVPQKAVQFTFPPVVPPEPLELSLTSALRYDITNSNPGNYYTVSSSQRNIVQQITLLEYSKYKEIGSFSDYGTNGVSFFLGNLGSANNQLQVSAQTFAQNANAWASSVQNKNVPLNGLADRLDSLNDRIVYYTAGSGPNQIGQSDLIQVVANLRTFLLQKSLDGVEFNPALKAMVEAAGAFTDEIENIQYLQSYPSTDKNVAKANLTAAQEAQKTLTEISQLADQLGNFLSSGAVYSNLGMVQSLLEKYDILKNKPLDQAKFETQFKSVLGNAYWQGAFEVYRDKLSAAQAFFSPQTQEKIDQLRENSWEVFKRNLANAYLTQRVGNPILSEFLTELKEGKFSVLGANQGVVEIDSKFLGKAMTDSEILEVGEYLKPFDDMASIQRQGLVSDLETYLKDYDPELKEEMKTFSLVNQYSLIKNGIAQGNVYPDRELPPELKDFTIISTFEYYLSNTKEEITVTENGQPVKKMVKKYDPSSADSRRAAMSDLLLKLGPVHKKDANGTLVLDPQRQAQIEALTNEYLANYGSKNPSSYLDSQILKNFEAKAAYYAEKELRISQNADSSVPADQKKEELSYDDLQALTDWLVEAKFDPSTQTAVTETARMDFLLSHYYGEDTEDLSAEDLQKNPELAAFYGEGGKGYFSEMDAFFTNQGKTVLTTEEKDRFKLLSSGVTDAWGLWQYDPSSLVQREVVLQNFGYANEYEDLVESLQTETKRLKTELAKANRNIQKEKYVNDYRNGLIHFDSYLSYLGVPTDNVATDVTTNEALAIQGRLRELEINAEQKLGGLFNLLENHKSAVFDQTPLADALPGDAIQTKADLNPGLRTAAKVMSSAYTLSDNVLTKDANGNYSFDGDFTNLKGRLDQALNVVSAGSVDYDQYAGTITSQSGLIATLKNTIETAGQSYVLLKAQLASGVNPAAELNAATTAFNAANAKIEGATGLKKQFEDAQALVTQKQNEYLAKETQVSNAYNTMLDAQDTFNEKAALYDYATLLEYSKHNVYQAENNNAPNAENNLPAGYIDTPKKMAEARYKAAKEAYDAKAKEVELLQKKMASQIGVGDLTTYVQNERAEAEKWALLAVKYNTAETLLRQKVADLKRQIGVQRTNLEGQLDRLYGIAPPNNKQSVGMMDSLEGSLDFGGSRYLKTEQWTRDRDRIAEGIISGRIGTMDVMTAYQWDYGQGITPDMQPYNLNSFLGRWGGTLGNDSYQSLPQRANAHMNSILFPAPETRGYRYGSGSSAATYDQAYGQALVNQTMVQVFFLNQLDLVCMGFCMLTMAYVNEINTYSSNRNQVNDAVSAIGAQGATLKGLYSQLQELTDVDDTNQLLSVLGRPEFGLNSQDLAMIQKTNPGSNSLKDIVWKTSPTATNPLSFNDLVGSDGLRLAQQKAIHDQYGNYVRSGEYTAGGTTASAEKTDQYGRQTALMVGADEFLDAMGVLAEAQYQVARDAYYSKAENYTKQIGVGNEDKIAVKVDAKVVLQEREKFASDLLKKITRTTNGETIAYNVETNIYRTVLNDYMGETGVVSQIFNAELQQRGAEQKQQWNLKEQEFYDLKSDWIQNVSYLKQTGTKRWENMVQEFQGKWKDWRADFKAEHEANQKIYLDRIESTLEKKEAWTTSFLQKSSEQADELTMKEMYDSIAGMVTSMQENLPAGVSMNVNVNDILSSILSKKPGSISASLIDRASSIDTNFFLNEVKKYNFNDSGLKEQFKGMLNETNKLSQNLIILQTLESLRSLPEAFAKTIQQQNGAVEEQLNQTMAYGGFARVGATYIRTIKTASGGDEVQTLGTYQYYNYNPPTVFPEVKDSNGKSWDLGKPELLIDREKVPSASDLTVMVRLAKNKMNSDFEKVFNPKVQHNYEAERGLFDPSEVQASFNDYLEGVRNGETVSCLGKSAEQCAQSAMNSGFLVGEVAEGSFGEAQFNQFYVILKTKKEMDKRKGKMDAARHRKSGGMGRFYNQLGAIGEGLGEAVKGAGSAVLSAAKASLKATTDFNGAKKDLKEAGKQGERALQGALYATSGAVDFVMFASETFAEPFVTVFTLGMGNETMNGKFAEGNYELAKFRDTNRAQKHLNELGMRTGAEMYANDAALDKVVTTTLAVTGIVGAILSFTPLAPIGVGLMAVSALGTAGWKTFRGAYEGGSAGMLAGAVSGIANSALDATTNGVVGVNLSYSYANGFGAGVNIGTDNKTQLGGSVGLNYNAKSGAWGASVGLKVGLGQTDNQGNYSNWVDAGVHMNNIGRENQSQGLSATIRGQYNEKKGLNGSLGLSYDTQSGYGATVGLTSGLGPLLSVTPSWTVSEYGGLSSDVQYGVNKNLFGNIFNKVNNPEHSAANRNLLDDIVNAAGGLVSGIGRGAKSAWDGLFGRGPIPMMLIGRGAMNANSDPIAQRYGIDGPDNKSVFSTLSDWFNTSVLGNKPESFDQALALMRSGSADARKAAGEYLNANVSKITVAQQAEMDIFLHNAGVVNLTEKQYTNNMKILYADTMKQFKDQYFDQVISGESSFKMTAFEREVLRTKFGGLVDNISIFNAPGWTSEGRAFVPMGSESIIGDISMNTAGYEEYQIALSKFEDQGGSFDSKGIIKNMFLERATRLAHEAFHLYQNQESNIVFSAMRYLSDNAMAFLNSPFDSELRSKILYKGNLSGEARSTYSNLNLMNDPNRMIVNGQYVYREQLAQSFMISFGETFNKYSGGY
ncbi:hypothetical protein FH581_008080 [Leptospira weilii]|uniref:hypothetical protein n=1 Tax=Leptospira weilii TaxID=28184 RepID=UPI00201B851A|nr:hypothetical protein [Leptospira weilii]UPY78805.1 hypothetical protein FH581_008080 [Leptospira weilii]